VTYQKIAEADISSASVERPGGGWRAGNFLFGERHRSPEAGWEVWPGVTVGAAEQSFIRDLEQGRERDKVDAEGAEGRIESAIPDGGGGAVE